MILPTGPLGKTTKKKLPQTNPQILKDFRNINCFVKHPGYTFQGYVGEILEWNKPKEGQVVHLFFFHAVLLCRCSISEAPEISHGYHQGSPDFFQKYLKWRNPHRHMSCMWYGLCKAIYPPPNIPENQVQYLDFRYLRFLVIVPSKKVGSTKPPPEGKDYKLYMFPANWGIIHMPPIPPFKGTRNSYWRVEYPQLPVPFGTACAMATRAVRKSSNREMCGKKSLVLVLVEIEKFEKTKLYNTWIGICSHEISVGMCYHLMCLDDVWLDENRFMWEAPINDAMVARRLQNAAATLGHFIDQRELSKATQTNHFQTHSQKLTWRSLEKIPHFSIGNTSTHSCWRNSSDRHVSFSAIVEHLLPQVGLWKKNNPSSSSSPKKFGTQGTSLVT